MSKIEIMLIRSANMIRLSCSDHMKRQNKDHYKNVDNITILKYQTVSDFLLCNGNYLDYKVRFGNADKTYSVQA